VSLGAGTKWIALALVGVAIAIGVAIAASHLTSQQIGIAGESASAGDALAPSLRTPEERADAGKRNEHEKTAPQEGTNPAEPTTPGETTPPSETAEPPAEEQKSDDYGGSGADGDD
jgi:hypothetical protein